MGNKSRSTNVTVDTNATVDANVDVDVEAKLDMKAKLLNYLSLDFSGVFPFVICIVLIMAPYIEKITILIKSMVDEILDPCVIKAFTQLLITVIVVRFTMVNYRSMKCTCIDDNYQMVTVIDYFF